MTCDTTGDCRDHGREANERISMTELRDELKVRPDEGAVEYAERAESALERHRQETGERLTVYGTMPGEGPGEVLARIKVLKEADGIREAGKARERQQRLAKADTSQERKGNVTATEESTRRFRLTSQERDAEKAVSEFEAQKKRLFRADGSKVYGEEEHAERLDRLTTDLQEKAETVAREAEEDVAGYEREALALSYTDPSEMVPASDRGRLEASRAFVKEDSEALDAPALTKRLEAVAAGEDRVSKILHARYARRRVEALNAESKRLATEGRSTGPEAARERRGLAEAVSGLEEQLKDPKKAERTGKLKEAAVESKRVAREVRRKLSAADGTEEAARRGARRQIRSAF